MHARLIAMLLVLVHAFAGMMPLARGESAPSAATPEKCCCCEAGVCCCGCEEESSDRPIRQEQSQEEPGEGVPACPCSPRMPVPVRTGNVSDSVIAVVSGGVVKQARRQVRGWKDGSNERATERRIDVAVHAAFNEGPSRPNAQESRLVWHCRWQV